MLESTTTDTIYTLQDNQGVFHDILVTFEHAGDESLLRNIPNMIENLDRILRLEDKTPGSPIDKVSYLTHLIKDESPNLILEHHGPLFFVGSKTDTGYLKIVKLYKFLGPEKFLEKVETTLAALSQEISERTEVIKQEIMRA